MDEFDDFEHELARLMHRPGAPAPFEPRHREGIWTAVQKQRALRRRRTVAGSVVAVMAVAIGAAVLPGAMQAGTGPAKVPSPASVGTTPSSPDTPQLPPTPSATLSKTPSSPSRTGLSTGLLPTSNAGSTLGGGALPTTPPGSSTTITHPGATTSR